VADEAVWQDEVVWQWMRRTAMVAVVLRWHVRTPESAARSSEQSGWALGTGWPCTVTGRGTYYGRRLQCHRSKTAPLELRARRDAWLLQWCAA
jgi:hypothetical protein